MLEIGSGGDCGGCWCCCFRWLLLVFKVLSVLKRQFMVLVVMSLAHKVSYKVGISETIFLIVSYCCNLLILSLMYLKIYLIDYFGVLFILGVALLIFELIDCFIPLSVDLFTISFVYYSTERGVSAKHRSMEEFMPNGKINRFTSI